MYLIGFINDFHIERFMLIQVTSQFLFHLPHNPPPPTKKKKKKHPHLWLQYGHTSWTPTVSTNFGWSPKIMDVRVCCSFIFFLFGSPSDNTCQFILQEKKKLMGVGLLSRLASIEKAEKKPHPPGAFYEKPLYLVGFFFFLPILKLEVGFFSDRKSFSQNG